MSIDAKVDYVTVEEDGSGRLCLVNRDNYSIAGQKVLSFDSAPHDVTILNGRNIWGGANSLLLGDKEFARRIGYTKIVFTVSDFSGWNS